MSDANAGVTDVARAISSICHALSPVTRAHLHALLAHTVAAPQPAETRARRLGLICELVTGPGRIGVPQYERLRSERVAEGWPAASTLIEHFGSWPTVLSLALRLQNETQRGGAVLASLRPHRDENLGDYTRAEVIAAIHLASETIGRIPSHAEYLEIRRVLREHARGTGSHMPRVPGTRTIKRLFADYDDAIRAASRDQSFRVGPKDAGAPNSQNAGSRNDPLTGR